MHQIYFIWNDSLHVSDSLSIHHQEFKTVHTATRICQKNTAVCLVHLVGFTIEIILWCTVLWTSNFWYNVAFMHYSNAQSSSVVLTYFHIYGMLHKHDWKFLHDPFLNLYFMSSFPFIDSTNREFLSTVYCFPIRESNLSWKAFCAGTDPHHLAKSTGFSISGMYDTLNTEPIFNVECLVIVNQLNFSANFL